MTAGARTGKCFLLDPTDENRVGRGTECDIVLTDPLCSRVHAVLVQEENGWWMRDADSRNGSFVNGQKIDEARVTAGATLRVGSTEFTFHEAHDRPTEFILGEANVTQTAWCHWMYTVTRLSSAA